MHSNIKIIGLGGMGANVLISLKKNGIIVDALLIDSECPDFINQQLDTYEPYNSLDFEKIGSADLLVIVTGLAGNICTKYLISIIQYAIKSCKDVVLVGVMPFIISRKSEQKIQKIANLQYYKSKANYGTKKKGISR